jgi:hypothetical protein
MYHGGRGGALMVGITPVYWMNYYQSSDAVCCSDHGRNSFFVGTAQQPHVHVFHVFSSVICRFKEATSFNNSYYWHLGVQMWMLLICILYVLLVQVWNFYFEEIFQNNVTDLRNTMNKLIFIKSLNDLRTIWIIEDITHVTHVI